VGDLQVVRIAGPSYALRVLRDIAIERRRQVVDEGYSLEHDDEAHDVNDLAYAAACYALPNYAREEVRKPKWWPWTAKSWKPTPDDRRRELVKAGALIVAEIERLDRVAEADELERGPEATAARRREPNG
jgi:hypothetical protein